MRTIGHLINGEFRGAAANTFTVINPATGEPLAEVAEGTAEDVDSAVAAARAAFPAWSRKSAAERGTILRRLADIIDDRAMEIAELESTDTGTPIAQTSRGLIPRSVQNLRYFAEFITRMEGRVHSADSAYLNYTLYRPVGVAGLITPWNLPFSIGTWKVAPALAFGNTAILKPAEQTPLTSDLLGRLALEAGVPPGVLNIVHGHGETAGDALVRHEDVNVVSFTGASETGRIILDRGAVTLKRFSMELGGKSPVLVFADCNFDRAMDASILGMFLGNGQRCNAGTRILVERPIYGRFVEEYTARAARLEVGDPLDSSIRLGPLVSAEHLDKVTGYIERGRREGARVVIGGARPAGLPPSLDGGFFIEPTVLVDVDNSMSVAQDEIFGPVACLIPFDGEDEARRIANDTRYGLSAFVWTENLGRAHRLAADLEVGMLWINSQIHRNLNTPLGGTKDSGLGREGGVYSLETFAEIRNVCVALGEHDIPRWGAPSSDN